MNSAQTWLGRSVQVQVEIPAWSRRKTRADGSLDFIAPLPCPWDYGHIPGKIGGDGDPLDALLLAPRAAPGQRQASAVQGVAVFMDGGLQDDKLICAPALPALATRLAVGAFLLGYGVAKRLRYWRLGRSGATGLKAVVWRSLTAP